MSRGPRLRKPTAASGSWLDHAGDAKLAVADTDLIPGLDAQSRRETIVNPDRSRGGCLSRCVAGGERSLPDAQLAAQGIAGRHRLDLGEHVRIASQHHARKLEQLDDGKPSLPCLVAKSGRERPIGHENEVGAQQIVGLIAEGGLHPVGEERDRGDAGDGNDQHRGQQSQLAGAPVPSQHAPRECQRSKHQTTSFAVSRPAAIRRRRRHRVASASSWVTSRSVVRLSRLSANIRSMIS